MDFSKGRDFIKSNWSETADVVSPQQNGEPLPPVQNPIKENAKIIDLPSENEQLNIFNNNFTDLVLLRKTQRKYLDRPVTLKELGYLLFMSFGFLEDLNNGKYIRKVTPSGGCRHPFENYLIIKNVEGVEPGIYRYLFLEHKLEQVSLGVDDEKLLAAVNNMKFVLDAPVVSCWCVNPKRGEWRYHLRAHKLALLDAGHICQNLYLASLSIQFGCCAVAAYNQKLMDEFLGLDGDEQFTAYLAPFGPVC